MKKALLFLLVSLSSIAFSSEQSTPFDRFFGKHPLDAYFGSQISRFSLVTAMNDEVTGLTGNISMGIGWRFNFFQANNFSIAPRLGLSGGYLESNGNSNITFQAPMTLNFSVGAGASSESTYKYGFAFGAGFAANGFSYVRVIDELEYTGGSAFFSPVVNCSFNFEYKDGYNAGFMPSLSWNENDFMLGLHLVAFL